MMRHFYPYVRAHHAYSMAIDFGMRFKKRNGLWQTESLPHLAGLNCQIDVADESLYLLTPQPGDVIQDAERKWTPTMVSMDLANNYASLSAAHRMVCAGNTVIIQRNGIPFFWPESEAA